MRAIRAPPPILKPLVAKTVDARRLYSIAFIRSYDGKDDSIIPYYWIGPTSEESEANMALQKAEVDGIQIPVLTNSRGLKKMTQLSYFKQVG